MSTKPKWKSKSAEKTKEKLGLKNKEEMSDNNKPEGKGSQKISNNDDESVASDKTSSSKSSVSGFSNGEHSRKSNVRFPKSGQENRRDGGSGGRGSEGRGSGGRGSGGRGFGGRGSGGRNNYTEGGFKNNRGDKNYVNNNYKDGNYNKNASNGKGRYGNNKRPTNKVKITNLPIDIEDWRDDVENQLRSFFPGIAKKIDFKSNYKKKNFRDPNCNELVYDGTVMYVHFYEEDEARYFVESLDGTILKGWCLLIGCELLECDSGNISGKDATIAK